MRQSITTKYSGPTNSKGSRVSAVSSGGLRLSLSWDDALNSEENHTLAAISLANKYEWPGKWAAGCTKDGYVFVNVDGSGFTVVPKPR